MNGEDREDRQSPGEAYPFDGALVVVLALTLVVLLAPHGAGFTTDSDAYGDVAANLLAGRGLVQYVVDFWRPAVPEPLGMWPPAYPALVALVSAIGLPIELAARLVAAAGFAVFAYAFHTLATRALGRAPGGLCVLFALALPGVALVGAYAWSESTALAFLAAGLALLFGARGQVRPRRAFVAGTLLALAALTRYAALPVVVVVVAVTLASPALRGARLPLVLAAIAPPAAWMARNGVVVGRPFGPALPPSSTSPAAQAFEMARALRYEFLPAPFDIAAGPALVLGLALLAGFALAFRSGGIGRAAGVVAVTHLATVLLATSTMAINAPTGRFLSPALPFLALAALAGLIGRPRTQGEDGTRRALVTGLTAVLAFAAVLELVQWASARPVPAPEILERRADRAALRSLVPRGSAPVLSDRGHAVRMHTGRPAVQVPPPAWRPRDYDARDDARWAAAGVREAVFERGNAPPAGAWGEQGTAGRFTYWVRRDESGGTRP